MEKEVKRCSRCQETKPLSEFHKNRSTKDGYSYWCGVCKREQLRKWRAENPIKTRRYSREYFQKWKAKHSIQYREHRRKYEREYLRKKRQKSVKYCLENSMGSAISYALQGNKNRRKWEKLVKYTLKDLMRHLEKQFSPKMTWDNYGSYWEIDHIKPKSLFHYKNPEDKEFQQCWALNNLQPLEVNQNRSKHNKYLTL